MASPARLCVLLIAAACLLAACCDAARTKTIRLGFLGSTNLPNANTQAGGAPALFAARLAIKHLMAQTDILPNTKLELINNNTNSDAGTANFAAYDQIQSRGVVGIIGEYNSGVSVAVAYPSRFYRVPMVSYGSTSPDFTTFHNTQFQYFTRMCPSQNLESILLAYTIKHLGWTNVGLVYTTDTAGVAGAQAFQSVGQKLGLQVVGSAAFALASGVADVYYAMEQLKAKGPTILLFIGSITDMQQIIRVCTLGGVDPVASPPLGMYGKGYQWIGLHSYIYTTVFTNATGGIVPHQYEFVQGMIGLQNFVDLKSQVYKDYLASWLASEAQPDLPSVNPSDPNSLTAPGNFGYDAVLFYAHALHRMEHEFGVDMNVATPAQRALFLAVLKNVTFEGVSGPVSVDANGDRFAPFDIMNFQGKELRTIGKVTAEGVVTLDNSVPIQFMGGEKALDYVVRGVYEVPRDVVIAMTVVTCITMAVVVAAMVGVVSARERSVMKAASPPFILSMLVGVLLLLASLFPRIYEDRMYVASCTSEIFLANLGYTLIVGSLLVKTYRIDSIFRMKRFQVSILTNLHLFAGLLVLVILQTTILLGLSQGDKQFFAIGSFNSADDYRYCSSSSPTAYTAAIMSFRFLLLFVTAVYTYRIRNVQDAFNESKTIGMVTYNLSFLSFLLPIIDEAMGRGKGIAIIVYCCAVWCIAFATTGIMLLPKCFVLATFKSNKAAEATITNTDGGKTHESGMSIVGSESPVNKKTPSQQLTGDKLSGGQIAAVAATGGVAAPTKTRNSMTSVPLPRTSRPMYAGVSSSAISPVTTPHIGTRAIASGTTLGIGVSSPSGAPTARSVPASPRIHVSRGVSTQLMQLIAQRLAEGNHQAPHVWPAPIPSVQPEAVAAPDEVRITLDQVTTSTEPTTPQP